ncbi:NUDIX domain-containing protein [Kutzneria viridogrisea]|uniref:Nudix hydrolase domain-containing protein n=2 Tax=Kutzneria TaxID=43356 RepID=W5W6I3_9PSEU|nr:NUDIX domain-containing protein [Kutzneria albida]AHH93794.1 hypothetical protein KALB_417 [Kutzneria albida DSM 43870]MBA8931201.1 8-oxo-dGTP pyrophosphatase MutT (NUDIX family) [Kutzneria viridogrisea]
MIDKVAWLRIEGDRVLCARSHGKTVFYLPGGKREPGESDLDTLVREIREELAVDIAAETARPMGVFTAQADRQREGVLVRMSCYAAEYSGEIAASNEIAEVAWLTYADRERVAPVDKLIFDEFLR